MFVNHTFFCSHNKMEFIDELPSRVVTPLLRLMGLPVSGTLPARRDRLRSHVRLCPSKVDLCRQKAAEINEAQLSAKEAERKKYQDDILAFQKNQAHKCSAYVGGRVMWGEYEDIHFGYLVSVSATCDVVLEEVPYFMDSRSSPNRVREVMWAGPRVTIRHSGRHAAYFMHIEQFDERKPYFVEPKPDYNE
jgi:hypothetical protein